ncbi:MAG TPA: phosphopantetheine-binding protein [Streptosporangiaceae bacterium]|nr:phosphopantetheine-binding protein [Streptosporangiaceae bacterium]
MIRHRPDLVDDEFEPPADGLEQSIAAIAAQVLQVDLIGRSDSLFDFDATSMDALHICAMIEAESGYQVPPHWLFETDVIADLADRIKAEARPADA